MLDPASRARDFPSLAARHYLNTAAEGIPPPAVAAALAEYAAHKDLGMRGRDHHFARLESCREISAAFLGLSPGEVAFASCSSEAYNLLASALQLEPGDEVVVTDLDFPAGATPWLRAGPAAAPVARLWQSRDGELLTDDLAPLLTPRTRLVQVSLVSFYNGHHADWAALAATVRSAAPQALLAVDVTQALGRVPVSHLAAEADIIISSTHKWILASHGGGIVGIPRRSAQRLTTRAGGWFHLANAFDADRFERAEAKPGAASYAVGMPNFPAIYCVDAALRYLAGLGNGSPTKAVEAIRAHADPLLERLQLGLTELGLEPMCPLTPGRSTGITAIRHPRADALHQALEAAEVHAMHHAGRLRFAVHGYNTPTDIENALGVLAAHV
jgi:cysteine desulfurase/selenocysteine lyase